MLGFVLLPMRVAAVALGVFGVLAVMLAATGILVGRVIAPSARYPEPAARAQFYDRLIEALASAFGVEAAAATSYLPAGGGGSVSAGCSCWRDSPRPRIIRPGGTS